MAKLPPKRQLFVNEYCKDGNGTQAAIRAGYSPKTANEQASQLLAILSVQEAVQAKMARRFERAEITAEKILRELSLLAFSRMKDYLQVYEDGDAAVNLANLDDDKWAAVQEVTSEVYVEHVGDDPRQVKRTKFKLAEKRGALELLGKHHKLWTDKYEHSLGDPLDRLVESLRALPPDVPACPPTDAPPPVDDGPVT